jgi:hypothetical protein
MADGGQLKLGRAREHIGEVREIARRWLDGDAFTIDMTTDNSSGRTEARARVQGSPPDQLALAVGDAIHNVRAALDHAVFDAAYRHAPGSLTKKEQRDLEFPIFETEPPKGFAKKTAATLLRVPGDVRDVIEEVQPYHWNDEANPAGSRFHTLWRVHDLDRIDKHRRLTVMAASLGHHLIGVPDGVEPDEKFYFESGPVHDGQLLASYLGAEEGVQYLAELGIVLAEGDIREDSPLDEVLWSSAPIASRRTAAGRLVSMKKGVLSTSGR